MQLGDGRNKSNQRGWNVAEVCPGDNKNWKFGKNRRDVVIVVTLRPITRFVDNLDVQCVIALHVASIVARASKLIAPRVATMMAKMPSRARLHITREPGANGAD